MADAVGGDEGCLDGGVGGVEGVGDLGTNVEESVVRVRGVGRSGGE